MASTTSELTRPPGSSASRRIFDLLIAIPAALSLSPLLALLAIWIKLDSRGPIFFRQERIGRFGRPFLIFKFRTMVVDAVRGGAQITVGSDPRITRAGYFLRKYKLDELPQLFNVIKGEMGLVGPRPEVPRYVQLYTADQISILSLRPGITSPASIAYNNESELLAGHPDPEQFYRTELITAKINLDLNYARRATVWSDCVIIARTFLRILE